MLTRKVIAKSILSKAIDFEKEAHHFYQDLQQKVSDPEAEEILQKLAGEEKKHMIKLQALVEEGYDETFEGDDDSGGNSLPDLPEDILEGIEMSELDFGQSLGVARRREIISYRFYRAMARNTGILVARRIFFYLATEEMRHLEHVEKMRKKLVADGNGE